VDTILLLKLNGTFSFYVKILCSKKLKLTPEEKTNENKRRNKRAFMHQTGFCFPELHLYGFANTPKGIAIEKEKTDLWNI
jgi:hypothetical protein